MPTYHLPDFVRNSRVKNKGSAWVSRNSFAVKSKCKGPREYSVIDVISKSAF